MVNLRKLARGKPCMVRLPGCTGGGEDTALAHYRLAGLCGIGMKPDDLCGAWCCASCHDICDGRKKLEGYTKADIRLAHAEGCLRTVAKLSDGGFV